MTGLKVYIGFSNTTDYSGAYDDVTSRVIESISFLNGVEKPFEYLCSDNRVSIVLDNSDKYFSPENSSSPLYGLLVPFIPCSIIFDDTFLFHGFVTDYQPTPFRYNSNTKQKQTVTITCSNTKFMLDQANYYPPVLTNKTADQIISYIFENVAFPPALLDGVWRLGNESLGMDTELANIDNLLLLSDGSVVFENAGDNLHKPNMDKEVKDKKELSTSVSTKTAWDLVGQAATDEHGFFYFDRRGRARFFNRYDFFTAKYPIMDNTDRTFEPMEYATLDTAYFNKFQVTYNPRTENTDDIIWSPQPPVAFAPSSNKTFYIDVGEGMSIKDLLPINASDVVASFPIDFSFTANKQGQKIVLTVYDNRTDSAYNTLYSVNLHGTRLNSIPQMFEYTDEYNRKNYHYDRILEATLSLITNPNQAREWLFFEKANRKHLEGFVQSFTYKWDLSNTKLYDFTNLGSYLTHYWSFNDLSYTDFTTNLFAAWDMIEPQDVAGGLVSFWEFEEDMTTVRDDSVGSNNLTPKWYTGASTIGVGRIEGLIPDTYAACFSINDGMVLATNDSPTSLDIGSATNWYMSFCFYIPSATGSGQTVYLADRDGNTNQKSYEIYINSSGVPVFNVSDNGTSWTHGGTSGLGAITYDQWNFCEVRRQTSDSRLRISINRSADYIYTTAVATPFNGTSPVRFGEGGKYVRIDQAGIWKSIMPSISDRHWLYNGGLGRTYTEIASATGNRLDELTGYVMNDTGEVPVVLNSDGYYYASMIRSTPTYMSATAFNINSVNFFIDGVFLLDNKTNTQTIVEKGGSSPSFNFKFYYDQPTDRFIWAVSANGTSFTTLSATTFGSPNINTPYYFQIWHDDTNDQLGVSINGIENTSSYSGGWRNDAGTNFTISSATNSLDGDVRNVRVWKKVFNQTQRKTLCNNNQPLTYNEILETGVYTDSGTIADRYNTLNLTSQLGATTAVITTANGGATGVSHAANFNINTVNLRGTTFTSPNLFSFGGWVSFADVTNTQTLLKASDTASKLEFELKRVFPGDDLVFYFSTNGGTSLNSSVTLDSSIALINTWCFVAFCVDKTNKTVKLVLNDTFTEASFSPSTYTTTNNTGEIWFGYESNSFVGEMSDWFYAPVYLDTHLLNSIYNEGNAKSYYELTSPLSLGVGELIHLVESQVVSDQNYTIVGEKHNLLSGTNPIRVESTFYTQPRQLQLIKRNYREDQSTTFSLMKTGSVRFIGHIFVADMTTNVRYVRIYAKRNGSLTKDLEVSLWKTKYDSVNSKYVPITKLGDFTTIKANDVFVEGFAMLDCELPESISIQTGFIYMIMFTTSGTNDANNYWELGAVPDSTDDLVWTETDSGTRTHYTSNGLTLEIWGN